MRQNMRSRLPKEKLLFVLPLIVACVVTFIAQRAVYGQTMNQSISRDVNNSNVAGRDINNKYNLTFLICAVHQPCAYNSNVATQ